MPESTAPTTGTAVPAPTAAAARQPLVRSGRRPTLGMFSRRGVLQPSGAARLLRSRELVSNHRGPALDAALRPFFGDVAFDE